MTSEIIGKSISIRGIVQGVGFRPFVYTLAESRQLKGWIRNTSHGVEIEINGPAREVEGFIEDIRNNPPPLAKIDQITIENCAINHHLQFSIISSYPVEGEFLPVSADASICSDCQLELFNITDRRYRYPFINCTNCGPRFSIIQDIPYDRPNTTMNSFKMCDKCENEYHNPLDRRFHAQPIACPDCGPQVWFQEKGMVLARREKAIQMARHSIANGKIIAVKGLGGFHLVCDATNTSTIDELRRRKYRSEKPFAIMVYDIITARQLCNISSHEESSLNSIERPIVLLEKKNSAEISGSIAPNLPTLGIMLPYTPLHYLLLEPKPGYPKALVMTSGNISDEPIVYANDQAIVQLKKLADSFLLHDREIQTRIDDSVAMYINDRQYLTRRARGFAPQPILLQKNLPKVLATGSGLKNTFCLTRDKYAFMSHHIGDLENLESLSAFETSIMHYKKLFRIQPDCFACDLHPDYLSSKYAQKRSQAENKPLIKIQHHHAHLAACLADNNYSTDEPVIGLCFDGTGLGTDKSIWGSEFLLGSFLGYQRLFHLKYTPLPGGDQAVIQPFRIALAHLWVSDIEWSNDLKPVMYINPEQRAVLEEQIKQKINTPLTSSMGRLFDAASSLLGLRQIVNYEAQAAIELEGVADKNEKGFYPVSIDGESINTAPLWIAFIDDLRKKIPASIISSRFHNSIVEFSMQICNKIRMEYGCKTIALSGGVWQNRLLLIKSITRLESLGFNVLVHSRVPTNDGGIALGQAVIAAATIENLI